MLLTIERVITLKGVEIFSRIPDDRLAELALILREVQVEPGETVISKGEQGRSMFLIVKGRVRVHDGEREIATLGEHDVFGELAALDPEPRSASVSAVEPTHLFQIDHDALYELMAEHLELVHGVIAVLCDRLRQQTRA